MVIEAPSRPMTYEDLEQITDTGHRYEILQGELIVSANPVPDHIRIGTRLSYMLMQHVTERDLGELFGSPVDIRFTKHDIVAPDLTFVSHERRGIVQDKLIEGAPDLVIEILSPSTQRYDKGRKLALYATGGVREYWIVDPFTASIRVINFEGTESIDVTYQRGQLRSAVLPEVEIDVEALFRGLRGSAGVASQ
jgi:Uma2 family endonuclease